MSEFYIVKYAAFFFPYGKGLRMIARACSATNCSYTAKKTGITQDSWQTREEAEVALAKMVEFNPSAGYGIVEGL
ncbi:MAG TPA: hypothetical protein VIJ93_00590 [bacterium]